MEEFLQSLLHAILFAIWILLIPVVMLLATPFVLLWPAKKAPDGKRKKKNIPARYRRVWRIWIALGIGLPGP
jgi:hypothetical protein